jgi:hypothetical protein
MPQLVEGMRAMKAGRAPAQAQLSAIGQAPKIAKSDRAAQRQIEGPNRSGWGASGGTGARRLTNERTPMRQQ